MNFPRFLNDFNCSELNIALVAALSPGVIIRSGFHKYDQVVYKCKNPGDLVTGVDELSEKIILSQLKHHGVTSSQIISEESLSENSKRMGDLWIIDPLDSTIGYVHGIPSSTVLIAYSYDDIIQVSVIYFPIFDELFFAVRNKGCWYLDNVSTSLLNKVPRRVLLNIPSKDIQDSWIVLNKHAIFDDETSEMTQLETSLRTRPIAGLLTSEVPSSGIACRVASGKIGAVIHDNSPSSKKQRCWDMAAPKLIVEEAGGYFCNFRGEPTNIWKFEPIIIAQSRSLLEQILNKLES